MRFYKSFLPVILAALISIDSFAMKGEKDPLEVTYIKNKKSGLDPVYQKQLRRSEPWKNFQSQHGNWSVEFNESNQLPHKAYGKPIPAHGSDPATAAMHFLVTNLKEFNLPMEELYFQTQTTSGKYHNVFYIQKYQGLEVLNSKVFVKMTKDFRVNTWGADVYKITIPIIPSLSKTQVIEKAQEGMPGMITNTSTPELKILPLPEGRSVNCRLVYELVVSVKSEANIPSIYYTLVDANNGQILYRHNKVKFAQQNSNVNVVATVYEFNPYVPSVVVPLRNLKVTSGASTYYTDSIGNVSIVGVNPISANFSLEGHWSKTVTDMGNTPPVVSLSLGAGQDTATFDSVTTIHHTSGYYHVNIIHDFMKVYFPTFNDLDFPLPTRIDVSGGFCNAFYSGNDINFFEEGGGCHCMSQIADIVYHEYGHGINDKVYVWLGGNFDNGAMHEGYSDVWALSLTQNPVLGIGNSTVLPNDFVRRYDVNRKVYPQDIHGESHDDGEIIAGAWYDVSLNLSSWPMMTTLFSQTFYDLITGPDGDEGQVFSDILLAALNADDDDADLSNGTPHDSEIITAFALHGIMLMNNASITHDPVYSAAASQPIDIVTTLTTDIPFLPTYLQLYYKTDFSSPYTMIPFLLDSGITYSATIPAQTSGTVISYYIHLIDSTSLNFSTLPHHADTVSPNIPYFIIVDCQRVSVEDFDANQSPGWLTSVSGDNATGGIWVIDTPLVSFKTGDTCQTGVQHTPGGNKCAVTGNALSPSYPNYNSDVDGGKTTLQSPVIDLTNYPDAIISYWRWYTNDQGSGPWADFWQTYVSADGINFTAVENVLTPDHSWRRFVFKVDDYLPGATSIVIRFVADDAGIASVIESAVDDIEVYVNSVVGIKDFEKNTSLSLFPNPASTFLTMNMNVDRGGEYDLDVINNLGQTVIKSVEDFEAGKISHRLDIHSLESGIYFLVLKNGDKRIERKFSVIR